MIDYYHILILYFKSSMNNEHENEKLFNNKIIETKYAVQTQFC